MLIIFANTNEVVCCMAFFLFVPVEPTASETEEFILVLMDCWDVWNLEGMNYGANRRIRRERENNAQAKL